MSHQSSLERPEHSAGQMDGIEKHEAAAEEEKKETSLPESYEKLSYGSDGFTGLVNSPYVFAAALLASLGGFSFGYDQGVISLILTMPQFHKQYPETAPDSPRYGFHTGFMTGMLQLGSFLGCLFYPKLADVISRKWGLTTAVGFYTVGAIIQTVAMNYATLVAGRFVGGIGVGTLAMGAPLYISEIAPPELRGSLLVLEQLSIVTGAIIAYWITYGTRVISGDWAFRLPFLLQIVPALCVGGGIHLFPFSPRWLALKGRQEDSLKALSRLRRLPVDDHRVLQEWKGIVMEVTFQRELDVREHPNASAFTLEVMSWLDLFKRKYIKRTMVAVALPFFQQVRINSTPCNVGLSSELKLFSTQFSGINAFEYYAPTFFDALGQDYEMGLILTGMVNICQLVAVLPALLYLDRLGRRNLTIWGGVAMGIPHTIMAGIVGKYSDSWSSHKGVGWFGVALIYIYILAYGISYGPLAWCMPAEVFPNSRRAKGVGLATAINWLSNFIIGVAVPPMVIGIGYGTFIFFASFCFLAAAFAYFCIPETSGKTLEQMDVVFGDNLGEEEKLMKTRILRDF
ncbi:MAG: hypothetical protein M1837_007007 [Sclerophora amabilis]|nr:MAG: hypothetical protein M1837_007007 [Sclerophora amabilis]